MDEMALRMMGVHSLAMPSFILLTILILSSDLAVGLNLSEIMYNPSGSDTGMEWIELYDDGCNGLDLEQYRLFESGTNHIINSWNNISMCNYALICDDCSLLLDTADIPYPVAIYESSFSLSNVGEYIAIKEGDDVIASINYSGLTTVPEGFSLMIYNNTWMASQSPGGSPGAENFYESTYTNNTMNSSLNATNSTINITINATTQNATINITIGNGTNTTSNETINSTHNSTNDGSFPCLLSATIEIRDDPGVFANKAQIKFRSRIMNNGSYYDGEFYMEYWIEDILGTTVKDKIITRNDNEKSFTPNIAEEDKVLMIRNRIINASCDIDESSNTSSNRTLIVINPEYSPPVSSCKAPSPSSQKSGSGSSSCMCPAPSSQTIIDGAEEGENTASSNITISDITMSKDLLSVKMRIHKGDTRKSVVEIYVGSMGLEREQKYSEVHKIKMLTKYQTIEAELPIYINAKPRNCSDTFIIVEGIDANLSQNVDICPLINGVTMETGMMSYSENPDTLQGADGSWHERYAASEDTSEDNSSFRKYAHNDTGLTSYAVYSSPNQANKGYSMIGIIGLSTAGIVFLGRKMLHWRKR
jgi:hypothetical protein